MLSLIHICVGWKPANEVVFEADTVLFLGSNFPFAEVYEAFKNTEKFIQVDIDPYKLGKRHALDASILGDAGQAAKAILDKVNPVGFPVSGSSGFPGFSGSTTGGTGSGSGSSS